MNVTGIDFTRNRLPDGKLVVQILPVAQKNSCAGAGHSGQAVIFVISKYRDCLTGDARRERTYLLSGAQRVGFHVVTWSHVET